MKSCWQFEQDRFINSALTVRWSLKMLDDIEMPRGSCEGGLANHAVYSCWDRNWDVDGSISDSGGETWVY